jgi:lysophospholipase L1-like esterase
MSGTGIRFGACLFPVADPMRKLFVLGLIVFVSSAFACRETREPRPTSSQITRLRPSVAPVRRVATREIRVVLLGDSLARGMGAENQKGFDPILEEELEKQGIRATEVANFGRDGARTRSLVARLATEEVAEAVGDADVIILSIGANDLFVDAHRTRAGSDEIIAQVLGRLDQAIDEIRSINGQGTIFVIGLYNPFFESSFRPVAQSVIQRWNQSVQIRYQTRGVRLIETADLLDKPERLSLDQFHPNGEGYRLIAERIAIAATR